MEKLKIAYPVIVEGKYDRLRLLSVMEGQILATEGFGIFNQKEKLALFRALAEKTPVIVLTDPDGAGTLIRSYLSSALPRDRVIPLYVPQIKGKEKRKAAPGAQGLLGVEGQEREGLYELLAPFAAEALPHREPITKLDLYEDGLTGARDSAARRDALCARLSLPSGMTPNALLAALCVIVTREEYKQVIATIDPA